MNLKKRFVYQDSNLRLSVIDVKTNIPVLWKSLYIQLRLHSNRQKPKEEIQRDRNCYMARTYLDYQKYLSSHPDAHTVQMDSVIGSQGGKVLLTIYFVECSLMVDFLRNANTARSVTDVFEYLTTDW